LTLTQNYGSALCGYIIFAQFSRL